MSVKVMSLVWDVFSTGGTELVIMLALSDWANDEGGSVHPSMRAIAQKARVSEKQARRVVHILEETGWVSVVGNQYGGAPGTTRNYAINVERLRKLAIEKHNKEVLESVRTPPMGGSRKAETPPADVTPPIDVTPPMGGRVRLPWVGGEGSHGWEGTPPMGGSQSTSEPSVNHQLTTSLQVELLEPEVPHNVGAEAPKRRKPSTLTPEMQDACRKTWESYSSAYENRYAVKPIKNAKNAGEIVQFVKRVGMGEAPDISGFYPMHNGSFYVSNCHPIGLMLKDAEKLRMEWATGRNMTTSRARQIDRTEANAGAASEAMEILRKMGEVSHAN